MPRRPSKLDLVEAARERETFRYDTSLIPAAVPNDTSNLVPSSELRSSADSALTAFAQLAALRLGASRALVSLFDSKHQYIVAEATPTLPLVPHASITDPEDENRLWLCGTALPRSSGLCERVLLTDPESFHAPSGDVLPVSIISDLANDPTAADRPLLNTWLRPRFYAGVPIRTRRGINIGVFCVFGDEPRSELDRVSIELMRGVSQTIMDHLDARRTSESHRKAVRMVRGMGSFVEGKSTMSGWKHGPQDFSIDPALEGALNRNQQQLQDEEDARDGVEGASEDDLQDPSSTASPRNPTPSPRRSSGQGPVPSLIPEPSVNSISSDPAPAQTDEDTHMDVIRHVFSKASNIIRESIEVEGVVFLDASIGSFAGLATKPSAKVSPSGAASSSSSSSDEVYKQQRVKGSSPEEADVRCRMLGHSNSVSSSIDQQLGSQAHPCFSERFLSKLLRRYPRGKIFSFDENGYLQSSDFSDEETPKALSPSALEEPFSHPMTERDRKRSKRMLSRANEGKMIMSLFSGARSVALVPIWDSQKQRWYAGGFIYTKDPLRILTVEGELSYLRAFGAVIMAEVARVNAKRVDKAKSDLLSSLSHELRSPLHGILLGAELLHDTPLDAFQGDVLHSVETCGHTLLDTLTHLLDFSKLNNFLRPTAGRQNSASDVADRGLRTNDNRQTIEAGMISLTSNVNLDVLVEEVVESVVAGFSFQRFAVAKLAGTRPSEHADTDIFRRLDSMQAAENMTSETNRAGDATLLLGEVSVTYDINPAVSWAFRSQPGALRRIVLNVLGNSLKYTSKGFINLSVLQVDTSEDGKMGPKEVHIIVADSGQGMSEDYLRHHLFAPFYQEDTLSAGTGLGLSIVKEVVTRLGGSIQVQSKVGRGTRVTIKLPLEHAGPASPKTSIPKTMNFDDFRSQVSELRGLRARLLGFPTDYGVKIDPELAGKTLSEGVLIGNVCREWLQMQIVDETVAHEERLVPDLVLSTEKHLDRLLFERRHGLVSTPVVVVCRNALIARQLATSPRFTGKRVVFEFVSQPIGPRKLARILLLSFRRWTKVQASAIQTPTVFSLASIEYPPDSHPDMPSSQEQGSLPPPSTEAACDPAEYFSAADAHVFDTSAAPSQSGENATPNSSTLPDRTLRSLTPKPERPQPSQPADDSDGDGDLFMLVEDNQINLRILESYMKKLGHKYTTAMDGQQAVDAFEKDAGRYKCIFMDISMPVMDGFEATREIRVLETQRSLSRCQVFALTGLASASAQEEAFASGIDLFLTKPVKLKELSKILETRDLA
ncbi:sensor histidine kinase response [Colletotrichum sojae]|uniref:Sensor histidine kinase response n=1 Tax=Colletotrichum sojae TaxID=2175907 RepID=A0A8H6J660_9PEZI|nr:sensor histidine kinase response [Colletotrichum sojae]